jgi:hypothetical protein
MHMLYATRDEKFLGAIFFQLTPQFCVARFPSSSPVQIFGAFGRGTAIAF